MRVRADPGSDCGHTEQCKDGVGSNDIKRKPQDEQNFTLSYSFCLLHLLPFNTSTDNRPYSITRPPSIRHMLNVLS